ncbi:hypothetical protein niasHS_015717 [Heterodera schachtii]|uniref:Uncharacterized protein n=1 Tax=Heterodera schachtii TaxID=97005 RepID=A0ABD2HUC1_HETSC
MKSLRFSPGASSFASSPSLPVLHRAPLLLLCAMAAVLQLIPCSTSSSLANAAVLFAESGHPADQQQQFGHSDCAQLAAGDEERMLLCQLYESSALLAQLGILVNEGIGRLAVSQGMGKFVVAEAGREKRKHEYLRFGKRKHEYLRFGRK